MKNTNLLMLALFLCTTSFAQNLILNSGFETGNLQSWSAWQPNGNGTVAVVPSNQRTGSYAVQVNSREASIEQIVTGLSPNTTYLYSVWVKCATGAGLWVGVKDYGGTETYAVANATIYEKKTIAFTTGATNTSAKIYLYRHPNPIYGNTDFAWGDDFELIKTINLDLGITGTNLLRVYESTSDFSLTIRPTITQGSVDNSFKLSYYWKDFFGNVQGHSDLALNTNNTILPPQNTSNKKFYSLVFETNNPNVLLPQRIEAGTPREYGVCFLTKTPVSEKVALNTYPLGMIHLGDPSYDDPFLPSLLNRNQKMEVPFTSNGAINNAYVTETNNLINKGFQPVPWVPRQTGSYWNWNDSQPITDTQLQLLEQQMEAYFRVNPQIICWEVGWEENVQFSNGTRLTDYPYYWANLKRKIEVTKRAANRVSPNIKLCYQISTTTPNVHVLPFVTSEAAAFYDVLAFHSYKFDNFPMPDTWLLQTINEAKNLVQQYRPHLSLWITETGAPNDALTIQQSASVRRLDMKDGSSFLAKTITIALANDIKKVFWYNYHDKCTDISNIECQFGMIDYWGFPRAAYATFYTILKNIRDKTFKRKIETGNSNVYTYEFEANNGEKTLVSWSYPSTSSTLALSSLGINSGDLVKEVLATEGSNVSLIQNSSITIPDYPIFINLKNAANQPVTQHSWTRINPGGGGSFEAIGAGSTGVILAGSDLSGAYRSTNNGQTWQPIGAKQGVTVTHISAVGFHPTDGNITYLGSENGIFRSTDAGINYTKVLDGGFISDIKFAPSNTNIGYAAYHTMYNVLGTKIYKTTDNGLSWAQVSTNLPSNIRVTKILVSPTNANTLFALSGTCRFANGTETAYRSTDGGVTWTQIGTGLNGTGVMDLAIHPTNPSIIYLTTYYKVGWDTEGYFYRSTDGGNTWTLRSNRTGTIWVNRNDATKIRLIDVTSQFQWRDAVNGTWLSTDEGTNWSRIGTLSTMDCGYQSLDPVWKHYWSYGGSFAGYSHTLGESLANGNTLLWVNGQWVFMTTDGGANFQNLYTKSMSSGWWQSTGIDNVVVQDFAIGADNNTLYAGFWDIGLWRSLDRGVSWQSCNKADFLGNNTGWVSNGNAYGGNSFTIVADPTRPNVVWSMLKPEAGDDRTPATLIKSTNYGEKSSWTAANTGIPSDAYAILGLSVDKNSPNTNRRLFVTVNGNVYRSTNDGTSWSLVLNNGGMRTTAVDNFNSNYVYAAGEYGFWRSQDGGTTWTEVGLAAMRGTENTPPWTWTWQGVYDIKTDPNNANWVYVAAFGTGKGLWRSTDRGTTWTKLRTDDYQRTVAIAPQNSNLIYSGSSSAYFAGGYNAVSKGVQFSKDGGNTWQDANENMAFPFANVIELDNSSRVYVGSTGTGFQYSVIPTTVIPVELLNFTATPLPNISGSTISKTTQINWQTASEKAASHFDVERSINSKTFEKIGEVKANGNTQTLKTYSFVDETPHSGVNYYRLRQVDENGTAQLSNIVSVTFSLNQKLQVFPNPAHDKLTIISDATSSYSIFNVLGREILRGVISDNRTDVDIAQLSTGLYFVKTKGETVKFFKN